VEVPGCGLYRTGIALAGKADSVPAGTLVYFHNHSEQGPPLVQLPHANTHNHWTFHRKGYLVEGDGGEAFLAAMERLPRQGYYVATGPVGLGKDREVAARGLVQVGYNRAGHPIVFVPESRGASFSFPETGFRFESLEIFESLREAGFDRPVEPVEESGGDWLH
jgi:hypothetical protein